MKIMYDYQIFSSQKYGGISRYFYEIIHGNVNTKDLQFTINLLFPNNHYLLNSDLNNYKELFPNINFSGKQKIRAIANRLYSIKELNKSTYDIFHPTYYNPYFLKHIGKTPFVLTVFDMIHEKFDHLFSSNDVTTKRKRLLVDKASKIIAISENTKRDLIDIFGVDDKKISVIHLGSSMELSNSNKLEIELPKKYILFVGSRKNYKNFDRFVEAVSLLIEKDRELYLVCIGDGEFGQEELDMLKKLNIINNVYQYDIDDKTLAEFYKRALVFVFPSLYEGFGIPVLEAFACGCPLVCSNTSSLPEIGGDAALYFDPYSVESIFRTIEKVIYDKDLRNSIVVKANKRLKQFSWDKTIEETNKVYESVL